MAGNVNGATSLGKKIERRFERILKKVVDDEFYWEYKREPRLTVSSRLSPLLVLDSPDLKPHLLSTYPMSRAVALPCLRCADI